MHFYLWICLSALIAAGCHRSAGDPSEPAPVRSENNKVALPAEQVSSVTVEPVESCKSSIAHLHGRLVWDENVTVRVFTAFAGRVTKIMADVGQQVTEGAPLALIASPDYGQAQAEARRAASDFALAERNLTRIKELFEHGASAQKELQAAEADYERALSEKQRTLGRLALYGSSTNSIDQAYTLASPLNGVIVERNLNPGQEIRADAMLANTEKLASPLFVVTDPTRLWIEIDAFEQDLPILKKGAEILIRSRAMPDQTFTGTINSISDFVDPIRKVISVRGGVKNPERLLKAEMFVSVDVPAQPGLTAGLDVPAKAVFSKGEKRYVFLEESLGHYQRREVKVGPEHDGKVLVLGGLEAGQRVVSEGCLLLEQTLHATAGS